MNTQTIREYAELMKEYNIVTLEIEEGEEKIKLERRPKPPKGKHGEMPPFMRPPMGPPPAMNMQGMPSGAPYGMPQSSYPAQAQGPEGSSALKAASRGEVITSPMVGVFYAAPAENAEVYVKAGDTVKKGDTLCIIEAMKLMNEITAERDGKITEILAQNGDVVEYGTPLFVME